MKVKLLMTQNVIALLPDEKLRTALELMKTKRIRHIPIVNRRGEFLGLITHRDILAASASYLTRDYAKNRQNILANTQVKQLMQKRVRTTTPEADLRTTAKIMLKNKWGCLPVLKGKRLAGILTASDYLSLSINLLSMHERLHTTLSKDITKS